MIASALLRLVAVTALLAAGCGTTNPPAAGHLASGSRPTPSSGTGLPTASAYAGRNLALVRLRGSNELVVRDITDINHPNTVSAFAAVSQPQFVNASEISYIDYAGNSFIRVPLGGSPKTVVATSDQFTGYVDWSPDGSTAIYVVSNADGSAMALHQVSGGQDRVLSAIPPVPGVGCITVASCAIDLWDVRLLYSPDGAYISFVNSIVKPAFRLWSSDGKLLKSSDLKSESMSVWSGRSFYFRDANGVQVWRDGVVSPFLQGVQWVRPQASPAGGQIVYQVRDAQHWSHTYVVDTNTRQVRDLGRAHAAPVFLTPRYIWYQGERACVQADGCGTQIAGVPSGKTYVYDLVNGTESGSVITSVYDVWPRAA